LLLSRPLIFFGGKGGVGKTTLAAAYSLASARAKIRTLLVSTDPAHSTSHLLGLNLGDEATEVEANLWGVEIDADAHAGRYIDLVAEDARAVVSPEILPTVGRHLEIARSAPGMLESALLERFMDLMEQCPATYDRIVFDTAPTGHALRMLQLPALLSVWVEGLASQREKMATVERFARNLVGDEEPAEDRLLDKLRARQRRVEDARRRLLRDATFNLVLNPERLPIEETARALALLREAEIEVGAIVVNRILPDVAEGEFLAARLEQQRTYLQEIDERFSGHRLVRIEQAPHDFASPEQLEGPAATLASLL